MGIIKRIQWANTTLCVVPKSHTCVKHTSQVLWIHNNKHTILESCKSDVCLRWVSASWLKDAYRKCEHWGSNLEPLGWDWESNTLATTVFCPFSDTIIWLPLWSLILNSNIVINIDYSLHGPQQVGYWGFSAAITWSVKHCQSAHSLLIDNTQVIFIASRQTKDDKNDWLLGTCHNVGRQTNAPKHDGWRRECKNLYTTDHMHSI